MQFFKKSAVLFLLIFFISNPVFAFGKKDKQYYVDHPEKAKARIAICTQIINKLAEAGNIKKIEKMLLDPECNAAKAAMKEIRMKIREQKQRAAREAERAAQEAEKKMQEQKAKERAATKAKVKAFLKEHYNTYRKIPLVERMNVSESEIVQQWKKECRDIANSLFCRTYVPGGPIYEESYKQYKENPSLKNQKLTECLNYWNEFYEKNKKDYIAQRHFNERTLPSDISYYDAKMYALLDIEIKRGSNECHAVYDVIKEELYETFKAVPLEKRIMEYIRCEESGKQGLCSAGLKRANNSLTKIYKEKFLSDSNAKSRQYAECKRVYNKISKTNRAYRFEVRSMGECKAAGYW